MKIRWTRKVILVIVAYLAVCFLIVYLGDFVFAAKPAFLPSVIVGIVTIAGGFLLAYWLIESSRFSRELERKKRILSALKTFKNSLLPWIFHYACTLSTNYELFKESEKIANRDYGSYKSYFPQLEDIFGIGTFDKDGRRLRGTDTFNQEEFLKTPIGTQSLYHSLNYGLKMLEQIERRIREFPTLPEEIDPKIAPIVHLSQMIGARIKALQEWENKHGKENMYIINGTTMHGLEQKSNLRKVGHYALDIAIAIDKNIEGLKAEL